MKAEYMSGWALAIADDMLYFTLLMVSTLWLSGILGDERLTVGVVLVAMWVLPFLIRRWRPSAAAATQPSSTATPTISAAGDTDGRSRSAARRRS